MAVCQVVPPGGTYFAGMGYTATALARSTAADNRYCVWLYNATLGFLEIRRIHIFGGISATITDDLVSTCVWEKGFSSFLGFALSNMPYIVGYRASDGTVAINRIDENGNNFTQTFFSPWESGFTAFAGIGSTNWTWSYRQGDGAVRIHEINSDGTSFTQKFSGTWDTGFTHFFGFGAWYVFAYRAGDGTVCIQEVKPDGSGFTTVQQFPWSPGFTHFAAPDSGLVPIWAYRASDGLVAILTPSQAVVLSWNQVAGQQLALALAGTSSFCALRARRTSYVWSYNQGNGDIQMLELLPLGGTLGLASIKYKISCNDLC